MRGPDGQEVKCEVCGLPAFVYVAFVPLCENCHQEREDNLRSFFRRLRPKEPGALRMEEPPAGLRRG